MTETMATETPMSDHVARFWQHLETETVRILVDLRREVGHDAPDGPSVYWDGASFGDDVAKALVADRRAKPTEGRNALILVTAIDCAIEAIERGSTSAPVQECLKAALARYHAMPLQDHATKWRHKKRGSIVTEIARGFAQVAHHPIEEMTAVVIYRHDEDGRFWVRNAVEFDDGRFEPFPAMVAEDGSKS